MVEKLELVSWGGFEDAFDLVGLESTLKAVSVREVVLLSRTRADVVTPKSIRLLFPRLEARTPLSFRSSRVVALLASLAVPVARSSRSTALRLGTQGCERYISNDISSPLQMESQSQSAVTAGIPCSHANDGLELLWATSLQIRTEVSKVKSSLNFAPDVLLAI